MVVPRQLRQLRTLNNAPVGILLTLLSKLLFPDFYVSTC